MPAKQVMTHQGVLQIAIVAHQAVAVIPSRHWRPVLRTSLYRGSSPGGFVVTMLNSAGHYQTERVPRDQFSLVICSCQTAPNSYLSSPNSTLLVAICLWYQNDEIRLQTHPAHWAHLPINKIIKVKLFKKVYNTEVLKNLKFARIAKAALHKLPGESSLNVNFVCLSVLCFLCFLSVCP